MSDEAFVMPKADIGDTVLWFPDGDTNQAPAAAIVTHVSDRQLELAVIHRGSRMLDPRSVVRHVDDPLLQKNHIQQKAGAWMHKYAPKPATPPARPAPKPELAKV